ncbi:MAG: hypothetical protein ACOX2F_06430 [bacterium]
MKKILLIIAFLFCFSLIAEEGEVQINIGAGGFFPLSFKTNDKKVVVYSSWNVAINSYFGLSDNFDIGIQPSFTRLKDVAKGGEFGGVAGKEYFDYYRFQCLALVRYNLFAGTFFSPHLIAGGGFKVETFTNWDFFNSKSEKLPGYKKSDYSEVMGVVAVGIDLQFRVWEWIMLSTQVTYKWSPHDHSIDFFGFFGATFFVNYYR